MKNLVNVLLLLLITSSIYSCSSSNYSLGKDRFIISWDSVWGVDHNNYILTIEEIKRADKIIEDSIEILYLNSGQDPRDRYLDKNALDYYYRQYSSYIYDDDTIIVVNFLDKKDMDAYIKFRYNDYNHWLKRGKPEEAQGVLDLSKEWITVCDGGNDYWIICINLTKKRIESFSKNGYS